MQEEVEPRLDALLLFSFGSTEDARPRSCPQTWSPIPKYLAGEDTPPRYVILGGFHIDSSWLISSS